MVYLLRTNQALSLVRFPSEDLNIKLQAIDVSSQNTHSSSVYIAVYLSR